MEGVRGIAQILKNPGRALAALGQKATDVVEEKGIPYAVSYMVADITIGILVDKGIGKLRSLGKADDLSKISTKLDDVVDVADDFGNAAKAVDKIDDATDAVKAVEKIDDIEDTVKAVEKVNDTVGTSGLEGGSKTVDDVYAGVKQTSEYLKQQGFPRTYRKQILESFDVRTIKLETAGESTYGLRFYGGNASAEGRYLFETFPPQTNRANLALPYEWNSMTGIQQFQVKSGTTMLTGAAALQTGFGSQYIGGAHQWYINSLEDMIKCQ